MMIECIIIDDENHNIENLEWLLTKNCPDVKIVAKASSADEGIKLIREHQPDLVFLDIEMPNKNGFNMLENIDPINFEVVFVTAYNQYALKAIKFCALDYLMKPIAIPDLIKSVEKVKTVLTNEKENKKLKTLVQNLNDSNQIKKIALPTADELFFVCIDEIIRCKSENNYTIFHLTNGTTILVSKTLKEWDDLLSAHNFIRTHQSHLINSSHVKSFVKKDGGYILMSDESVISVSRNKKDDILQQLASLHKF